LIFFFNFKIRQLTTFDYLYFVFIFYIIIQCLKLEQEISLLLFIQALISAGLYYVFYHYNISVIQQLSKPIDYNKVSKLILLLLPLFLISFESWSPTRSAGIMGNPNITAHIFIMLLPFVLLIPQSRKVYLYLLAVSGIALVMFAS